MGKTVAVLADPAGCAQSLALVTRLIEGRGHRASPLDVTAEEPGRLCARLCGLVAEGRVDGVLGLGSPAVAAAVGRAMRQLPFALPKLLASPLAGDPGEVERLVGTRDIALHATVVDLAGMNPLLAAQLANAAGALCGMVETSRAIALPAGRPLVAVSSFGFAEMAAQAALGMLEEAGFVPVVCHAQGRGDRAMEEMTADGRFQGVLDLCLGGVTENLFGGNRDPGPDRLMAAVRRGVPMVLAPAGLDVLSYGGRPDRLAATAGRARYVQDSLRIQVRTTADELRRAAEVVAERLNQAAGPFTVLIPTRGWSSLDRPGMPTWDPEAAAAFTRRLAERLARPRALRLVDLHLYSRDFARAAVDELVRLFASTDTPAGEQP